MASDPGESQHLRHDRIPVIACRGDKPIVILHCSFRGSTPSGSTPPHYLFTIACFLAYASARRFQQGSILRSWLAITRWDFHQLDYATLPSRTVPGIPRVVLQGWLFLIAVRTTFNRSFITAPVLVNVGLSSLSHLGVAHPA